MSHTPEFTTAESIEKDWAGFTAKLTPYMSLIPSVTSHDDGMQDVRPIPHHANVSINISHWLGDEHDMPDNILAFFDFLKTHPGTLTKPEEFFMQRTEGHTPVLTYADVFGIVLDGTSPLGAELVQRLDERDQAAQLALAERPEWKLETLWDSGFDQVEARFVQKNPETAPLIDAIFAGRNSSYYQHLANNSGRDLPREKIEGFGGGPDGWQDIHAELGTTLGKTAADRLIREAETPAAKLADIVGWQITGGTALALPADVIQQHFDETELRQLTHARVVYPIIMQDGQPGYAVNGYGPQYAEAPEAIQLFERLHPYCEAVYKRVSQQLHDDIDLVRNIPEIMVTREAQEWTEGLPTGMPYVSHAFVSQLDAASQEAFERLHGVRAVFWEEELPALKDAPFGVTPEQLFIANRTHGIFCHGLPSQEQWDEHRSDLGWSARDLVKKYMDAPDTLHVSREAHIEHLREHMPCHVLATLALRRMVSEDIAAMDTLLPDLAGAYNVEMLLNYLRDNPPPAEPSLPVVGG